MAQKYPQLRKKNPMAIFERDIDHDFPEDHKVDLVQQMEQLKRVQAVARQLYEVLANASLSATERIAARQVFDVLWNRFGDK